MGTMLAGLAGGLAKEVQKKKKKLVNKKDKFTSTIAAFKPAPKFKDDIQD